MWRNLTTQRSAQATTKKSADAWVVVLLANQRPSASAESATAQGSVELQPLELFDGLVHVVGPPSQEAHKGGDRNASSGDMAPAGLLEEADLVESKLDADVVELRLLLVLLDVLG